MISYRGAVISREQAIEVVEQYLAADATLLRPEYFNGQERLVVTGSDRHRFGWLVYCQGERWAQTRDFRDMLVGHGYFLVDDQDGSLHTLHAAADLENGDWIEDYLEQVRAVERPDPLRAHVGDLLRSGARLKAITAVRAAAPKLDGCGLD